VPIASLISCIAAGMLAGSVATMLAAMRAIRGMGVLDVFRSWDMWPVTGAGAGALLGVLLWTLLAPRSRVRRTTAILVAINSLAWLSYLVLTPRMPDSVEDAIIRQLEGLDIIHDGPSMLAGREAGFWPVNSSHSFLRLMSGPAIGFAELHVMPGSSTGPTRAESYWIAVIAFVLSTAWWTTVGWLAAWIRSAWKHRVART